MALRGGIRSPDPIVDPASSSRVPEEPDGLHEDFRDLHPKVESARTDELMALSRAVLTPAERRIKATLRFFLFRRPCPYCRFESHRFEAGDETQCVPGTSDVEYAGEYTCPSCLHGLQYTPTLSGGWEWRPLGGKPVHETLDDE